MWFFMTSDACSHPGYRLHPLDIQHWCLKGSKPWTSRMESSLTRHSEKLPS